MATKCHSELSVILNEVKNLGCSALFLAGGSKLRQTKVSRWCNTAYEPLFSKVNLSLDGFSGREQEVFARFFG